MLRRMFSSAAATQSSAGLELFVSASDRSGGSGRHELSLASADGTHGRRLTRRRDADTCFTADVAPAWSPDGRWIALARTEAQDQTAQSNLWLARPDGTGLRRLTRTAGAEASPSWTKEVGNAS